MYDLRAILARLRDKHSPLFAVEQELVRCFYRKLDCLPVQQDPLFLMWQNELTFTYGNLNELLSRNTKIKPEELRALYGFGNREAIDLSQLLKSIQTFYSVLIKLITYNILKGAKPADPLHVNSGETIQAILSGRAFLDLGISNYCYDDWFSWLLKYWDEEAEALCRNLRLQLDEADTIVSIKGFMQSFRSDSLKHIYETVMPVEIRHALGEYYTPDWLAACAIRSALQASSQKAAELRFIDPTCGAGTFLTRVMRIVQTEAADGFVRPEQIAGFDINSLAVLTAKANFLATIIDQLPACRHFVIPVYHYDVINTPTTVGQKLVIDTNCELICEVPLAVCEQVLQSPNPFCADELLRLLRRSRSCAALWEKLAGYDPVNQRVIANVLLNRILACHERPADIVVGNPPWVNWEYLPADYKRKSQHLWPEYGLLRAKGPKLSFLKEDISVLITYIVIHHFLRENGFLSFVLRQAMFKSAQNGACFRRFRLEQAGIDFRVLQVDDLSGANPFEGINSCSALVLLRRGEKHTFPVHYRCWTRKKQFLKAIRDPDATAESVMACVDIEDMVAYPAEQSDPTSVWINAPQQISSVIHSLLGSNPYKARTGVFTGGANAVYWLNVSARTKSGMLTAANIAARAKRKVDTVTAELEPTFVYPLVRGNELSQWQINTKSYILCPHTAESKFWPVEEDTLKATAPKTYDYLLSFKDDLDARKGFAGWEKAIQAQHFYSVLRIGDYTFAPYKVAWRYIAQSFITAVITSANDPFLGEKLYIPNEKIMYVGLDCKEEAFYLCGILSSSPVSYCVKCYMNPTSISAHVLNKLNIPPYDPESSHHRRIAALCEEGHQTSDAKQRAALQKELDRTVGALYGISDEATEQIRTLT